jgi:hypothetical protein
MSQENVEVGGQHDRDNLLPDSEIRPLDAGHFAWEQASDEYGSLVVEWVTGGFQRLGGGVTA